MAVISLCEWIVGKIYPAPSMADFDNAHALSRLVSQMPRGTYFLLLVGYAIGSFSGGFAATIAGGREDIVLSVATGVVLMAAGIINLFQLPSPLWFMIASLLIYVPFSVLGYLVGMKRT
jgi:hypothetical protein